MKPFACAFVFVTLGLLAGCRVEEPAEETATDTGPAAEATPSPEAAGPATLAEGFSTPESVLYDAEQDVYFVSNINGAPLDADDNGYVSRITAGDRSIDQKWIDGSAQDVDLNAPKGMAILGDELWVSDIDHVRRFDRKSGRPLGSIAIEGSSFLNDLVADGEAVYVSDSGMNKEFQPAGTDQVYRVTPAGQIEKLAAVSQGLGAPNGLALIDGELWVVTFQGNELYRLADGGKTDVTTLPTGGLDGIVSASDGSLLVSSWEGNAVYRGKPGETFTPLVENVTSPADLGYDTKRDLVLIPIFQGNRVEIQPYEATPEAASAADPPAS